MPLKLLRDQKKVEKKLSVFPRVCDACKSAHRKLFKLLAACVQTAAIVALAQTVFSHSNSQTVFAAGDSDWVEDGVSEFAVPRGRPETLPQTRKQNEDRQVFQYQARPGQTTEPTDVPVGEISDDGVPVDTMGKTKKVRAPIQAGISTWQQGSGNGFDQRAARLLQQSPVLATPRIINADPKVFKSWLTATNPGVLEGATKESIVEIKGEWDDCAHALRTFGLPYTRVNPKKLSETNLNNTKIIVVNCEGHLPMESILQLRRFVAMGGYLLTTDWALENVVDKAFPGIIEWNEGYYTDGNNNNVVDAVIVADDAALTAGTPPVGHWLLVKKSQIVRILKPETVKVLARSRHMREDPDNLGILAVTFTYGNGRVMHLVGHFDNNSELAFNSAIPDAAPGLGFSLRQALAANFIAQALKQEIPEANSAKTEK
ncbi:hypothetical protein KF728_23080 [Candidatus Obscuribacterales bacterium]|nr:hypothetical protein [Candidatus Obscuribacterales bacterium]MBX3153063.1 hypothetical protein [Candidatus Obscuribacterales bacterium]